MASKSNPVTTKSFTRKSFGFFLRVSLVDGRWRGMIVQHRDIAIGDFDDVEDAKRATCAAAREAAGLAKTGPDAVDACDPATWWEAGRAVTP